MIRAKTLEFITVSPITEKKPNIEEDSNQKSTSKEETKNKETEEKPREITIRFIKKVDVHW